VEYGSRAPTSTASDGRGSRTGCSARVIDVRIWINARLVLRPCWWIGCGIRSGQRHAVLASDVAAPPGQPFAPFAGVRGYPRQPGIPCGVMDSERERIAPVAEPRKAAGVPSRIVTGPTAQIADYGAAAIAV
jgi:hypothetical protein